MGPDPTFRQSGPYIPRADGKLREWVNNFVAVIGRAPDEVGLVRADAEMLAALAQEYEAAYERAISPGTRTRRTVAEKNAVRRRVWDAVRPIAMRIKHNAGVRDGKKLELGLHVDRRWPSPVPRPRNAPIVSVVELFNGMHRVRCQDPGSPSRWAKPPGATALELRVELGPGAAVQPTGKGMVRMRTRHVFNVEFEPKDAGKTATYFGRWVTRRGLAGPWSKAVALDVVFGAMARGAGSLAAGHH